VRGGEARVNQHRKIRIKGRPCRYRRERRPFLWQRKKKKKKTKGEPRKSNARWERGRKGDIPNMGEGDFFPGISPPPPPPKKKAREGPRRPIYRSKRERTYSVFSKERILSRPKRRPKQGHLEAASIASFGAMLDRGGEIRRSFTRGGG